MAVPKYDEKTKTWKFIFDYYDESGERKQIRRKGFKSKREANDRMLELKNEVKSGQYSSPNTLSVATFLKIGLRLIEYYRSMRLLIIAIICHLKITLSPN